MDEERILKSLVRREEAGAALETFLAARFPYHTAEEWAALAAGGALLVNGGPPDPARPLAEGDEVRYVPPAVPEPPVDDGVRVLYEDADIIAVDKPGNLPAHPAGKYFRHTLWWLLRERFGVAEPSLLNRLDRETSGVTLAAKHPAAAAACRAQFTARTVAKKYTVFAGGALEGPLEARGYLGPAAGSAVRKKRAFVRSLDDGPEPGREAQWAETLFLPVMRLDDLSVLEAVPRTGRLHQIRATLLALRLPVLGDKIYGPDEGLFLRFLEDRLTDGDRALLRLPRQALHASELAFRHPADGRPMKLNAPLPADMLALLDRLP